MYVLKTCRGERAWVTWSVHIACIHSVVTENPFNLYNLHLIMPVIIMQRKEKTNVMDFWQEWEAVIALGESLTAVVLALHRLALQVVPIHHSCIRLVTLSVPCGLLRYPELCWAIPCLRSPSIQPQLQQREPGWHSASRDHDANYCLVFTIKYFIGKVWLGI